MRKRRADHQQSSAVKVVFSLCRLGDLDKSAGSHAAPQLIDRHTRQQLPHARTSARSDGQRIVAQDWQGRMRERQ